MDVDGFYAEFGRLLQQARRPHASRGRLTQAELAEAVVLSRASVANIERGQQRVQLHVVVRIAEILDMDISELIPRQPTARTSDGSKLAAALQGQGASLKDIERALVHLPVEDK